ncbi:MAG: homoserine O-acetyltransferase [Acidobacteria bacterium]|nr:MAG: homoserine O-acetyltransferase [Acidobacteriota bacterium]REJ99452.1 MAG: homoserine O-acetyltransferase [Acidobacteriota bacterium]
MADATSDPTPRATRFFEIGPERPLRLGSGVELPVEIAYQTWGELSPNADNAILVVHALTGSQHAAGFNPAIDRVGRRWTDEMQVGWWDAFIGPGKVYDTNRWFVVCANYVGGCFGSTGPTTTNTSTGEWWGCDFPRVTFADSVHSQARLLDHLGIRRLRAIVGPSTGGMACINFATLYPERVERVILIATGMRSTTLQRIHNFEQIRAIESDPGYLGGRYAPGEGPFAGMAVARMISHKTFVSLEALSERSLSEVRAPSRLDGLWYGVTHPLESYMLHQGEKFARRFDANSYLRILDAWNRFDPLADAGVDDPVELFARCREQRYLIFSIDSDVCYYPEEQVEIAHVLRRAGVERIHITVHSEKGHDSFLLEPELYGPHVSHLLAS